MSDPIGELLISRNSCNEYEALVLTAPDSTGQFVAVGTGVAAAPPHGAAVDGQSFRVALSTPEEPRRFPYCLTGKSYPSPGSYLTSNLTLTLLISCTFYRSRPGTVGALDSRDRPPSRHSFLQRTQTSVGIGVRLLQPEPLEKLLAR